MKKRTLRELLTWANEIAERRVETRFSSQSEINDVIDSIINKRFDDVLARVLGFTKDSWGNNWELRYDSQRTPLFKIIEKAAIDFVEKNLDELVKTSLEKFNVKKAIAKASRDIKEHIEHMIIEVTKEKLKDHIDAFVETEAEKAVNQIKHNIRVSGIDMSADSCDD